MMNREETDLNKNKHQTCLMHRNVGSCDLGSSGNNTPFFMSSVTAEMDDIEPEFRLECLTCGKVFTNRDDIDSHATSCQMNEDGVMSTSEVARSDSRFILNTNKECDKSTNGTAENTVEMSVFHNLSMECECSKDIEIENIDGKVLVVVDDKEVAEGIPLPPKENVSSSTEKSKFLEIKLSKKLSWIPCQFCETFVPNQAKLDYHFACRHYSPKIFDDTFDDRDQADKEKEAEGSDVQLMEEEIFIQPDVRMTRWFQCETCHDFVFSEDDQLHHLCRSIAKGQEDSESLEEDEDDWIGASNFGVDKDKLIRETEEADQSLIDKDRLNDPYDFNLDKEGEEENYAERGDPQLPILSKSRPFKTTQKSQKTNANCFNGKTRGKRGKTVQNETCDLISRRSERLLKKLGLPEKGQISIGLVEQESHSENMHPSSFNRKSRGKQAIMSNQNKENSYDNEKDDTDVVEKRSSHCKQIRKSRRERKLCSDGSTSMKVKSRESRTRKIIKGVNKLSSKNEMDSAASNGTRPNEKYKHQCTNCLKWFQGKSNLLNHMRSHTGEKPFECAVCFRKFSRKETLQRHQSIHDGIKPFKCNVCRRQFSQKIHLKRHRKLHNRVLPLKCRFCPMRFGHQYYLTPHERLHMGPRPFKCTSCPKAFQTKYDLHTHQLTHLTERPFKCDLCPRSFSRKQNLAVHKYSHTGERPHKCDVCSKGFRSKSVLINHKKMHSAIKRFKCDVCSKAFKSEKYLRRHKNVHITTEPFKCDICSRTFKLNKYLRVHKTTHSHVKSYKCDICDNIFKSAQNLYYHRKKKCVGRGKV